MSTTPRPLSWRDLRNPNKVWTAQSYRVELHATESQNVAISTSEVYDSSHPLQALGSALAHCQRLHPFASIDMDSVRIYAQ